MRLLNVFISRALLSVSCMAASGCVSLAGPPGEPVTPGQRLAGPLLDVRAPNSTRWRKLASNSSGVIFGKPGESADDSLIAQVAIYPLDDVPEQPEAWVAYVKRRVMDDTDTTRFAVPNQTFRYVGARGYPCALWRADARDHKASVGVFRKADLAFQIKGLYCRLPNIQNMGFAAIFSYRGDQTLPKFDAQADDFIEGVQASSVDSDVSKGKSPSEEISKN